MYQYKCKECGTLTAAYTAPVPEYESEFICGTCAGHVEDSNYSRQGEEE